MTARAFLPVSCLLLALLARISSEETVAPLQLLYSVSSAEGFNLRRDVQLRLALAVKLSNRHPAPKLLLPPWRGLPHWRALSRYNVPWSVFFNLRSMNKYTPVQDLDNQLPSAIDTLYQLSHFEDAFEGGTFVEKWELRNRSACASSVNLWGYDIPIKNIQCVAFQGGASKLFELVDLRPSDKTIMFTNAEIVLHDEYGTAEYWRARKSMKFSKQLTTIANEFIRERLECDKKFCDNYISAHWRRRDFARTRGDAVPTLQGTADQLYDASQSTGIKIIFIATDAVADEFITLKNLLINDGLEPYFYEPTDDVETEYKAGGIAIIDQIICSRAAYFMGTYESTFTYRIQEEREIMGFDSDSTFNRFCPDNGNCERPSRWTIVY